MGPLVPSHSGPSKHLLLPVEWAMCNAALRDDTCTLTTCTNGSPHIVRRGCVVKEFTVALRSSMQQLFGPCFEPSYSLILRFRASDLCIASLAVFPGQQAKLHQTPSWPGSCQYQPRTPATFYLISHCCYTSGKQRPAASGCLTGQLQQLRAALTKAAGRRVSSNGCREFLNHTIDDGSADLKSIHLREHEKSPRKIPVLTQTEWS